MLAAELKTVFTHLQDAFKETILRLSLPHHPRLTIILPPSTLPHITMTPEPIAVIGSACRFPGDLTTPSKLWTFLSKPHDVQSQVPKDRFNIDAFHHPDSSHHGRTNARHGYFLPDIKTFDAQFFNVQASEADSMDPQQRQLLEATYDALCAAGQTLVGLKGSDTAVYVGIMTHDFELTKVGDLDAIPTYLATGAATSIASNRLSYFYDWHGPSVSFCRLGGREG